MTIVQVAKKLGKHPATIRAWVRRGAPCLTLGSVGRGHGSCLDLDALQRWRVQQLAPGLTSRADDDLLGIVETALLDCLRRDGLAQRARITDPQAALIVVLVYERFFRNLKQTPMTAARLPVKMKRQCAIWLDSVEQRGLLNRRVDT